jgi:hypothetical protein
VVVETLGLARDGVCENPEIVSQAFSDDIKMPAARFELKPIVLLRSGLRGPQLAELGFDRPEATVNGLEATVDLCEATVDNPEAAIDRSFQLRDGHGSATRLDHNIVPNASFVPAA